MNSEISDILEEWKSRNTHAGPGWRSHEFDRLITALETALVGIRAMECLEKGIVGADGIQKEILAILKGEAK